MSFAKGVKMSALNWGPEGWRPPEDTRAIHTLANGETFDAQAAWLELVGPVKDHQPAPTDTPESASLSRTPAGSKLTQGLGATSLKLTKE